jgi:hypothetical protein
MTGAIRRRCDRLFDHEGHFWRWRLHRSLNQSQAFPQQLSQLTIVRGQRIVRKQNDASHDADST